MAKLCRKLCDIRVGQQFIFKRLSKQCVAERGAFLKNFHELLIKSIKRKKRWFVTESRNESPRKPIFPRSLRAWQKDSRLHQDPFTFSDLCSRTRLADSKRPATRRARHRRRLSLNERSATIVLYRVRVAVVHAHTHTVYLKRDGAPVGRRDSLSWTPAPHHSLTHSLSLSFALIRSHPLSPSHPAPPFVSLVREETSGRIPPERRQGRRSLERSRYVDYG